MDAAVETSVPLDPRDRLAESEWRKESAEFWMSAKTDQRTTYDLYLEKTPTAPRVRFEEVADGRIRGWWARPEAAATEDGILYLHGGSYTLGSAKAYRNFVSQIAARTNVAAFILDYPRAPEAALPVALGLVGEARDWLSTRGVHELALVGDSAGGGLALAALAARGFHDGVIPVVACVALSPWTDLTLPGAARTYPDPVLPIDGMLASSAAYLGGKDPTDPRASPVFAVPEGLPPLLIQVGTDERLLDDSKRYAAAARARGNLVRLEIWEGMHHVFQAQTDVLESSNTALDRVARFLREQF
ncbi:MAG TPA: alpha/beta hydrolase fold domain-containing protein [Polyangia bacterium]